MYDKALDIFKLLLDSGYTCEAVCAFCAIAGFLLGKKLERNKPQTIYFSCRFLESNQKLFNVTLRGDKIIRNFCPHYSSSKCLKTGSKCIANEKLC